MNGMKAYHGCCGWAWCALFGDFQADTSHLVHALARNSQVFGVRFEAVIKHSCALVGAHGKVEIAQGHPLIELKEQGKHISHGASMLVALSLAVLDEIKI